MATLTGARSITHEHLLAVVATEVDHRPAPEPVRILDVGCGDGALIEYLVRRLPAVRPGRAVELYGFDVRDHGVQADGFMDTTLASLQAAHPGVPWAERITSIRQADAWPYEDRSFDVVLSNQVLEHVHDHDRFFAEMRRVLRENGYAVHLYPLKHYVWEGHLNLPLVHRIQHFELLRASIKGLSRLGLGKYAQHRRDYGSALETFAERHADYMLHYTNYLTYREVLRVAKRHGMRPSFRYTKEFYLLKLRSMAGLMPRVQYRRQSALAEWLSIMSLRYVSSITLFLEKRETYRQ
jgi:SAM-dependent methyltransferase